MPECSEFDGNGLKQRRVRRSTEEIRALILDAARRVFAERGYAGASTRLIAERAKVAHHLIFGNFGSKSALFAEAVIQPFEGRFAEFVSLCEEMPPDREHRNVQFVHVLYPFLRENADLLQALVKSTEGDGADHAPGLDAYFASAEERLRSQYEMRGLHLDIPAHLMVRYTFGTLVGAVLLRDWFFPEGAPDEELAERALARMIFKISEPLGHSEPVPSPPDRKAKTPQRRQKAARGGLPLLHDAD